MHGQCLNISFILLLVWASSASSLNLDSFDLDLGGGALILRWKNVAGGKVSSISTLPQTLSFSLSLSSSSSSSSAEVTLSPLSYRVTSLLSVPTTSLYLLADQDLNQMKVLLTNQKNASLYLTSLASPWALINGAIVDPVIQLKASQIRWDPDAPVPLRAQLSSQPLFDAAWTPQDLKGSSMNYPTPVVFLAIQFSEALDLAAFTPSSLVLGPSFDLGPSDSLVQNITLSSSSVASQSSSSSSDPLPLLTVQLGIDEFHWIKAFPFGSATLTLWFRESSFSDFSGNFNLDTAPLQVDVASLDLLGPSLLETTLHWDSQNMATLHLYFSESISYFDSMASPEVFLSVASSGDSNSMLAPSSTTYQLSLNSTVYLTAKDTVSVRLSRRDAIGLRHVSSSLGLNPQTSFVGLSAGFVFDPYGNPSSPVISPFIQVASITSDSTGPSLLFYSLDMNAGLMIFSFDEPVILTDVSKISLWGDFSTCGPSFWPLTDEPCASAPFYQLTSMNQFDDLYNPGVENEAKYLLNISEIDLISIKSTALLASSLLNSFLFVAAGAFQDAAGNLNPAFPVNTDRFTLLPPNTYVPDSTGPDVTFAQLTNFPSSSHIVPNIATPTLMVAINFSEPVDLNSLDLTSNLIITLRTPTKVQTFKFSEYFLLPGEYGIRTSVSLLLLQSSISDLQSAMQGKKYSLFLQLPRSFIMDVRGNPVISSSARVDVLADFVPPELSGFTLNLGSGTLHLSFSESIDADSIDFSSLTLGTGGITPSKAYPLSKPRILSVLVINPAFLLVTMSPYLVGAMKADRAFTSSSNNAYLTLRAGAFADLSGNLAVEVNSSVSIRSDSVIADLTAPNILWVDVDIPLMSITLSFTEPVLSDTTYMSLVDKAGNVLAALDDYVYSRVYNYTIVEYLFESAEMALITSKLKKLKKEYVFFNCSAASVSDVYGNQIRALSVASNVTVRNLVLSSSFASSSSSSSSNAAVVIIVGVFVAVAVVAVMVFFLWMRIGWRSSNGASSPSKSSSRKSHNSKNRNTNSNSSSSKLAKQEKKDLGAIEWDDDMESNVGTSGDHQAERPSPHRHTSLREKAPRRSDLATNGHGNPPEYPADSSYPSRRPQGPTRSPDRSAPLHPEGYGSLRFVGHAQGPRHDPDLQYIEDSEI